jgi:very-short-patch-repair endonuclease
MEIWTDVKSRVITYPGSRQSPDFAALEYHEHGDFIIDLRGPRRRKRPETGTRKPVRWSPAPGPREWRIPAHIGSAYHPFLGPRRQGSRPGAGTAVAPRLPRMRVGGAGMRADGSRPDSPFVAALDRQESERRRGVAVLTVVPADSMSSLAGFAAWAAGRGYLTLVTEGAGIDEAIDELLAQMPWLRCLAMARRSLAAAAQLDLDAVDAALDSRAGGELRAWIDGVAGLDPQVQVSGWLLSAIRAPSGRALDPATAPVQRGALLSALCELAAPVAVLVHHAAPTAPWLQRALAVAGGLVGYLPGHPVAVGAPDELVARVLHGKRQSASITMGRQGLVPAAPPRPDAERDQAAQALHAALERDTRTAAMFERRAWVPVRDGGPAIEVDLAAKRARLAVVIDGWYHRSEPQSYQRDRGRDAGLGRAGYFVMRFAAEDIGARIGFVVNEIAIGLAARRT